MSSTTIYNGANIKFVSSVCGSGKSYALEQYIKSKAQHRNHLIVVPTLKLVEQYYNNLTQLDIDVVDIAKISTETTIKPVSGEIIKYLKGALDEGHILIITFQSYQYLEYFPNKDNWDVFIDELPQLDVHIEFDVSKNKQLITDFFELGDSINDKISTLKIKEHSQLKQANHSNDDAYKVFKKFYRIALSGNTTLFVDKKNWNDIIKNKVTAKQSGEIHLLCLYNPKLFSRTTLMGANIEDSLLYKWLVKFHHVNFQPHQELIKLLRYTEHNELFGQQVILNYFIQNRHYSKYLRDDDSLGEQMDQLTINLIGGENKTLFVGNNDYESELEQLKNVTKISPKSHGMNEYDDYNNIYLNYATNMKPSHENMLKALGLTKDDIKISVTFENYYQLIMRTSLRNIDTNEAVNVFVPDEFCASYMAQLLCSSNINYQEGLNVTSLSTPPLNPSQVNNRASFKKTMDKLLSHSLSSKELPVFNNIKLDTTESITINNIKDSQIAFTCHKNHKAYKQSDFVNGVMDTMKFINLLKKSNYHIAKNKDDGVLINSAIFNPNNETKGYRTQANFIASHFMILDFDNGNLSPEQFEKIFWQQEKHSFVITNSYSRNEEQPNRFRVFLFYKEPIYSITQHKAIYQYIIKTLNNNGIDHKLAKLDSACGSGNQSFYLPCTNQQYQNYSFFRKHGLTRIADIIKYGIDTKNIIITTVLDQEFEVYDKKFIADDVSPLVKQIIDDIQNMTSNRHQPFFDGAIKMRSLGLSLSDIKNNCDLIADNEIKMKNKVNGIMSSLINYH